MAISSENLFGKLVEEIKKLLFIAIYFWLLIGLFTLFKSAILHEQHLIYHQGFAIINALVLAKVALVADMLKVNPVLP